jgi:hypothetical protein
MVLFISYKEALYCAMYIHQLQVGTMDKKDGTSYSYRSAGRRYGSARGMYLIWIN